MLRNCLAFFDREMIQIYMLRNCSTFFNREMIQSFLLTMPFLQEHAFLTHIANKKTITKLKLIHVFALSEAFRV